MHKPTVLVILGQTATGKSALAVKMAKVLAVSGVESEIISADSRQVYKRLDIGTGKITKKEMRGVLHHLLDVVHPKRKFTAAEYQKLAISAMAEITKRNKIPIICGGTGFYIDAVTKGIVFPEVPSNYALRKKLALVSDRGLLLKLQKLDPERSENIDINNKVRLIRAIEIAKALGKVPTPETRPMGYKFIKIGLYLPPEKLKRKISIRLLARIREGMIDEAKKLRQQGLSWKRMEELGLEYRSMAQYLQNKITKSEMVGKLNSEIYKYAKRQMTWFKRDKEIKWFEPSKNITKQVLTYLQKMI